MRLRIKQKKMRTKSFQQLTAALVFCFFMLVPISAWANHDPDINDDGIVNVLDVSLLECGSRWG